MGCQEKSVLFLLGRFMVGGVERVTVLLANAFVELGWRVCIVAFKIEQKDLLEELDKRVVVRELKFPVFRFARIRELRKIMQEMNTFFVINQWAFPFLVTFMLRLSMPRKAHLINVYHTMPDKSKRIQESVGLKRSIITWCVQLNERLVYWWSDAFVVLSECYREVFSKFTKIDTPKRLYAIPNPLDSRAVVDGRPEEKTNTILYVGRLSCIEKRVDRVVAVWKELHGSLTNWDLEILGDGPDLEKIKSLAQGLPHIHFRGFVKPKEYYKRAKVLLLTSDFEGFPMTVIEAMSAGCVPVVYGSFPVAREIIPSEVGVVVEPPWDVKRFADKVLELIKNADDLTLKKMSSLHQVDRYRLDKVVGRYLEVFRDVSS